MSETRITVDGPRMRRAVNTLKNYITSRYPDAQFAATEGEDPDGTHPEVLFDVDDPHELYDDEFCDLLLNLYGEDGLPLYVFPYWPRERELKELEKQLASKKSASLAP